MAFTVKKRGKLTYYAEGERPVLSSLVTEELPDGDLKISFAGLDRRLLGEEHPGTWTSW